MAVDPKCPDCGVAPGEHHQQGCDVALCKACGAQALQCSAHDTEPTRWSGQWPGSIEAQERGWWTLWVDGEGWREATADTPGAAPDLNRVGAAHASGQLVWDPEAERLTDGPDTADLLVRLAAALAPIDTAEAADMVLCRGCGGFEMQPGQMAHQPGCLILRARRLMAADQ